MINLYLWQFLLVLIVSLQATRIYWYYIRFGIYPFLIRLIF